jgi:thymidine kinase
MAKLYFRHGAMACGKTLMLLAVAHAYEQQGKRVFVIKPELDDRFGGELVRSRAGTHRTADFCAGPQSQLPLAEIQGVDCVLVDEAQFLSAPFVDLLRALTLEFDIPVICYGLRTDFQTQLFEGSKRLLELADTIEEIKTTCHYCNRKGIFNMRLHNGEPVLSGAKIQLGAEESYRSTCAHCYQSNLLKRWNRPWGASSDIPNELASDKFVPGSYAPHELPI